MKRKTNISVQDNLGIRITPDIILGKSNGYVSGDILDANAVQELIKDVDLEDKQDKLVSGTNIKTIDNQDILGAGNIDLGYIPEPSVAGTTGLMLQLNAQGNPEWVTPSAGTTPDSEMSTESTNAVQNKVVTAAVNDKLDQISSSDFEDIFG